MKLFLCGKGKAACNVLWQCFMERHKVVVYTHPDSDLQRKAQEEGIEWTNEDVNRVDLWPWVPDIIVSIGYLTLIRKPARRLVNWRVMNCHYSLLPNHRGRSSVPWAIVDGDSVAGITYHWIDEGIDTGPILLQASCFIDEDETQETLFKKLHTLAELYFPHALALAMADTPGVPQNARGTPQSKTQYHRAGPPYDGQINPAWPREKVERFIRAMTYPPLAYAKIGDREIKSIAELDDSVPIQG